MKVSIITINFNQPGVTSSLIQSIPILVDTEIIVVDNGSNSDLSLQLQDQYPHIKTLRSDTNLGFAGGNNLGVVAATGEFLFFVNNDTEFTARLLGELTGVLDNNPNVGMISPMIRYYDNPEVIQYAGFTPMNYYTCRNKCIGLNQIDNGQFNNFVGPTAYCHGAAMMVRRSAIEAAGLMNEGFFLYYEEMDWCEHIRRAGYQLWVDNKAIIYHKESISVGKKSKLKVYFMNRNRMLFIRRNASLFKTIVFCLYYCIGVVPREVLIFVKEKNYSFIWILFKAIMWNFTHSKNSEDLGYPLNKIK